MHIFPVLIGKLRRDVTDDKEVLRNMDFPFIHRTVDSDSSCLEVSIRRVYFVAFDCNANSSKNKAATWASTNTVHLGSKLAVSVDTGDGGHSEFGQHSLECSARNSGNIGLRTYRAQ